MNSKFRYILVGLIFILIYEVYLIVYYEYEQYQTNSYVSSLENINKKIAERNERKQDLTLYIRTNAYQSYVAKATQNKKLAGEEVTNIVDESNVKANEDIDVNEVLANTKAQMQSPTRNMTNPEKWKYIFLHLRDFL
ncbi:MAG: hypothetical protein HHAS10_09900 [Candidatus Altimarinota bacterium]